MNVTALNSPSFRLYLFGSFIALNGLWVQRVIIGWLAWELTGSPAFVGLAAFLSLAPTIISGPIFGVIIDRTNIRIAFFLSYSGMIICSILLFSLIKTELLNNNSLLVICLFIGFIASAAHPIRMSLAPRLVDDIHLPSMVILTAVNFNTSRLIGPAVGGILIQTFDVSGAILCSIFSFIPVMLFITIIKPRNIEIDVTSKTLVSSFIEGIKVILSNKIIKIAIILSGITSFIGRGILETLPLISEGVFQKGPSGLGLITATAGAGALFSSITKALGKSEVVGTNIPIKSFLIALMIPLIVLTLGYVNEFKITLFLIFILGFLVTTIGISIQSKIQLELSDTFRGRVMSVWVMINMGSAALGTIIFGFVSDYLTIQMTQVVFGYIFIILIVFLISINKMTSSSSIVSK